MPGDGADHLAQAAYLFFHVTACSLGLDHQEPKGLGLSRTTMAEAWVAQDAVFWIEKGVVQLVPCDAVEPVMIGVNVELSRFQSRTRNQRSNDHQLAILK